MTTADQLNKSAVALATALARRNHLIHQMREEGASLRAIATAAQLTAPGVKKILDRTDREYL